ncbi:hypothetical protein evm_011062 [Chilo suppressalis]|nr:hypothetical protein evm_011526 [Chilo suppressalis]RVE44267.1 hypothetical protein evm_011062 [Chilo suppressalis]
MTKTLPSRTAPSESKLITGAAWSSTSVFLQYQWEDDSRLEEYHRPAIHRTRLSLKKPLSNQDHLDANCLCQL